MQFFPSKVSIWLNSCQETCASAREIAGADNLQSSSAHVNYFRNDMHTKKKIVRWHLLTVHQTRNKNATF